MNARERATWPNLAIQLDTWNYTHGISQSLQAWILISVGESLDGGEFQNKLLHLPLLIRVHSKHCMLLQTVYPTCHLPSAPFSLFLFLSFSVAAHLALEPVFLLGPLWFLLTFYAFLSNQYPPVLILIQAPWHSSLAHPEMYKGQCIQSSPVTCPTLHLNTPLNTPIIWANYIFIYMSIVDLQEVPLTAPIGEDRCIKTVHNHSFHIKNDTHGCSQYVNKC